MSSLVNGSENNEQATIPVVSSEKVASTVLVPSVSEGKSNLELVSPYFSLVSIFLVIIGWNIIYRNAKKLATRTETKSLLDDAMTILSGIEKVSIDYWLSGRKNRIESEQFILLTNAKLLTFVNRLKFLEKRNIDIKVVNLAKLSTLITNDCEDVDRRSNEDNRERVQLLLELLNDIHEKLYDDFHKLYKPTFRFIDWKLNKKNHR